MTANSEIAERLRATLATELKQDVSSITREHTLRGDLGLNSLDAIELMFKLEEVFDISISDEDMQGLEKVGDVIDYLERRLSGASVAPVVVPAAAARTVPSTPRAIPVEAPPPVKTRSTSSKPRSPAAVKHSTPAAKASAKKAKPRATRRHA